MERSLNKYNKGDIIVVPFPFTDGLATKRRPAFIISKYKEDIIVLLITSKKQEGEHIARIRSEDFLEGKLKHTSYVKTNRIFTMDKKLFLKKVGTLRQEKIKEIFSLQELANHNNEPHQTTKKYLDELIAQKILIEDKRKRFRFYKLNLKNPLTLDAISIFEKDKLRKRLQEDSLLNKLYEELSEHFDKCSFLVFGSATTQKKYNDIDIICFGKDKTLLKKIKLFELTFGEKIELLETSPRNITEIFREELIKKHLLFNNHDYFVKYLFKKN